MQPDHQLAVLAHRVHAVAADAAHEVASEHTERPAHDQERVHAAPSRPRRQERAQVLHHLNRREARARQFHLGYVAVLDPAAVRDAHDATRRDHLVRLFDERSA